MEKQKPLIVIAGPTAAGKTDFSIKLAKAVDGEIISADSMQVYRGLDIGTDKISPDRTEGIPHYLINIVSPDKPFSVGDFVAEADRAIRKIREKNKFPLIVGGTAFYIRALLYGLSSVPPADKAIRGRLNKLSSEYLYDRLKKIDPQYASRIHPGDRKRIIRALEVYELTGKPLSSFKLPEKPRYEFYGYFLYRDRGELYRRINDRVDSQIKRGLVEETKKLLVYGKNITAFQALGYKEMLPYIEGKTTLEDAVENLKRRTRQFAKRQFTWFRKEKGFKWINLSRVTEEEALDIIKSDLEKGGVL
ncbi:tRNA (adenosine(37)-N6)-dimethylallyltransferase MiaA [Desulfurobacterium sp.]